MSIETEIKIKVESHKFVVEQLELLGAKFKGCFYQKDCYFDNSASEIYQNGGCLRLRSQSDAGGNLLKSILCCKGVRLAGRVKSRAETETTVGEPDNLEQILNALGFEQVISFEKKRCIWLLEGCEVCLDELPLIGRYVEIEGESEKAVTAVAKRLNLSDKNLQPRSYAYLISEALKQNRLPLTEIYLDDNKSKGQKTAVAGNAKKMQGKGFAHIILNPSSGSGFGISITNKLQSYLMSKGIDARLEHIDKFEDIGRIIGSCIKSPDCRLIAVCGGDGTVREAIQRLRGSSVPLMILPGGTENLLAHELGCDKNIDTYKMLFENKNIRPFDVANVNGTCFTSILGIGIDAEVVELLSKNRSGNITHGDYIWPVWRAFWAHKIPSFTVNADGVEVFRGSGMLFAGNISRYATGLRILKDADFSDGLLDVCIYPCAGKGDILKYLSMTTLQIHTKATEIVYKKCRHLTVCSLADEILTQIDGDPGPPLPLDIEILPAAVNVYTAAMR